MRLHKLIVTFSLVFAFLAAGNAQQTNPVDRAVSNPITDTPNINPISPQQDVTAPKPRKTSFDQEGAPIR